MDSEQIIYRGKYVGKTVEWLQDNDPSYLIWAEETNPKIFEEPKKKKGAIDFQNLEIDIESKEVIYREPEIDKPETSMRPNINFDNEEIFKSLNFSKDNSDNNLCKKISGKLIYLASPYSHPNDDVREMNYKIISKIAAEMVSEGHVVLSPISYGHNLLKFCDMPSDWEFWYNFCVTFLLKCDELIVIKMPGWDISRGVLEEIEIAKNHNIKINFIEPTYNTKNYINEL
jgi:hypothetical protein